MKRKIVNKPTSPKSNLQFLKELHSHVIGYAAVHTFGIRLIYPGLLGFVQYVIGNWECRLNYFQ